MGSLTLPYGVIINSLSIIIGGFIGFLLKERLSENLRSTLPITFGVVSIAMGITAIIKVHHLPAVVLAIIVGNVLGEVLQLEKQLTFAVQRGVRQAYKGQHKKIDVESLIGIIVLFCASGTGIYGAMESRFTGDHSILFTKSLLDLSSSIIFGALLGIIVSYIAIPQFIILITIYITSGFILPHTTLEMIRDFTACGGIIMVATGLRIGQIKHISIVNMLPAFILVMPISYLYNLLVS